MTKDQAIKHCRELCEHIKSMDSESDDWKAIHALLVTVNNAENLLRRFVDQNFRWESSPAVYLELHHDIKEFLK